MILMTFLAMASHEVKKFMKSREPHIGLEDNSFNRWGDMDPGQAPYLLDDLLPPLPHPSNYHEDDGPFTAYCPPSWMYRTEYYVSEADNFGRKFPAGKAFVVR
ncbi:uncharacterized protein LOC124146973 [Haliotis rufescens]|uniref:uncharacterized protein LOC124146973 n=1 Tax=Haliotis rufescens TaxID=6454 RepID=UPI00201EC50D|nr:uncharacterized protein LOC124146973 [Haliotis rufescens]XP_046373516.2 uncharacterized protein LOC124146973 [Haliotis rufescens]